MQPKNTGKSSPSRNKKARNELGKLQGNDKKAEDAVVGRVLCTGSHAARQHRCRVADLVRQLFEHTPPDDSEMMYVKETVFGAKDGKPNNLWVNIL
jgi:hypothetical protein